MHATGIYEVYLNDIFESHSITVKLKTERNVLQYLEINDQNDYNNISVMITYFRILL